MFGLSVATGLLQGSTERTWNCVLNLASLVWRKINNIKGANMPKSRKRHHSRSRSRSRSLSRERDDKYKRYESYEKDRDGKKRKVDSYESPPHKRSLSGEPETKDQEEKDFNQTTSEVEVEENNSDMNTSRTDVESDSANKAEPSKEGSTIEKTKENLSVTPKRVLSPKQLKRRQESEKKRLEKQKEREEKERTKNEERERTKQEKLKMVEERQKEKEMKMEQKKKEKEEKEEQKRREKEEKEKMRKDKEEREEQKRKEREQEKLKKQQEIDEKNKEKQKEEEKKQKAAMAFVKFFVPIKRDCPTDEANKLNDRQAFKTFEVKSDMKLAPLRRNRLTEEGLKLLDKYVLEQDANVSYLVELKQGKSIGKSRKTWPCEDTVDDDVICIETDSDVGETVDEDKKQKFRAKFLKFHENRRPPYFGTWRKRSKYIKPRKPLVEDPDLISYEEDSDDDWEEEEQGESLNGSDDEADKENEDEKDDYEIDNDFFVPHGHLSEDEIDDEEEARLAPELMKQKLKLLKDEFEQDMQSKTHKLKPRYIGCVWYNKDGSNVDEAIDRYLKPLAMMTEGQIIIKARHTIVTSSKETPAKMLDVKYIPIFMKIVHGNTNKQRVLIEEFMTHMANTGYTLEMTKKDIKKNLKSMAKWTKCKNRYCWLINEEYKEKYGVDLKEPALN